MEGYPVEIDPEQVVRWLMIERERSPSSLIVEARRVTETRQIQDWPEIRLGDEEREDLRDKATIAVLDVSPRHADEGWRMTISVEDEVRPSDSDESEEEEEPIDLDTFYLDYIRAGRGTVGIIAEIDGRDGEGHLRYLLKSIETNAHAPESMPT
jgi:hypothetical protein